MPSSLYIALEPVPSLATAAKLVAPYTTDSQESVAVLPVVILDVHPVVAVSAEGPEHSYCSVSSM